MAIDFFPQQFLFILKHNSTLVASRFWWSRPWSLLFILFKVFSNRSYLLFYISSSFQFFFHCLEIWNQWNPHFCSIHSVFDEITDINIFKHFRSVNSINTTKQKTFIPQKVRFRESQEVRPQKTGKFLKKFFIPILQSMC